MAKTLVKKRNTTPFKIVPKMKFLSVNLTMYLQDLITENYKKLMEEVKEHPVKRDIECSRIRRVNLVKMLILSKLIYGVNAIPIKTPERFYRYYQIVLKCMWKNRRPKIAKASWKKKNKVEKKPRLTVLQQQNCVTLQKHTLRSMEHMGEQKIEIQKYAQLIWQRRKRNSVKERQICNKWFWSDWTSQAKKINKPLPKYHALYKKLFKMYHRLRWKLYNYKTLE